MDAATLEETNKLRIQLGMKPLPVPGAAPAADSDSDSGSESGSDGSDSEPASTVDTRQAAAYDNYKKLRDEEEAKKKREAQAAAIKKAREKAQRFAQMEGKGLGDAPDVDVDAKSWLLGQKKRQKKIARARKLEEEQAEEEARASAAIQYSSKDLAGVKVAHDMTSLLDGDEQILTLKDTTIGQNEEEGDELENIALREQEMLQKNIELKKKKADYNPLDMDDETHGAVLSKYDEEIYGEKSKMFTLDGSGTIAELADILDAPSGKADRGQAIDLDMMEDIPRSSDYLDVSEIKVKKPKKKKNKSTRQKPLDEDDILFPEPEAEEEKMDVDSAAQASKKRTAQDANLIDDDDLQYVLAQQRRNALKKRKRVKPEDFAKQLKESAAEEQEVAPEEGSGLVIGEVSEFVASIKKPEEEDQERKPKKPMPPVEPSLTAMDSDSDEDVPMNGTLPTQEEQSLLEQAQADESVEEDGLEEKTVAQGMGATLSLLRERGLVKETHGAELHDAYRHKEQFLAKKAKMEAEMEEAARKQREQDRKGGHHTNRGHRDQQELARQHNNRRDQINSQKMAELYNAEFKPTFELKYTDEHGRSLDQKEAWTYLSHKFHGKGSGKGKTDKRLKKIADEQRRESQSVLDASQNVGMSAVTAQQLKKRREAGVRLA